MKNQVHPRPKTLLRSVCYVRVFLVACVTPVALAEQDITQQDRDAAVPVTGQSHLSQDSWQTVPGQRLPKVSSDIGVRPIVIKPIPKFPEVILYDQLDNAGTVSWVAQEFPDMPDFTAFLADDFFVPGGQSWQVTEVYAQGAYFNGSGPANNFNIFFYQDSGGLPGTLVSARTAQAYVESGGVFEVSLTVPVTLASGIYWVSVQAHMPFDPNGQWGWTERSVQTNSPAAWQNPAGGFGVCLTWDVRTTCLGAGGPDQLFRLIGTVGPPPTPTPTPRLRPTPRPHSTPLPRP